MKYASWDITKKWVFTIGSAIFEIINEPRNLERGFKVIKIETLLNPELIFFK